MVTIKLKKLSEAAKIPTRGSDFAAGYDLYATEDYVLLPLHRKLFKTGISIAIPNGLYGRIAPRSGLAFKDGIDTLAGVIDEDYRGDVGVILINLGDKPKEVKTGDKIAQIIFETYHESTFQEVTELSASVRATGGFGSTDAKITFDNEKLKAVTTQPPTADGYAGPRPGESTLADLYQKTGGVAVKKRYSEEVKERNQS